MGGLSLAAGQFGLLPSASTALVCFRSLRSPSLPPQWEILNRVDVSVRVDTNLQRSALTCDAELQRASQAVPNTLELLVYTDSRSSLAWSSNTMHQRLLIPNLIRFQQAHLCDLNQTVA